MNAELHWSLERANEITCLGCGVQAPDTTGPVHTYIEASPGCWQMYCALQDWRNSLDGDDGVTIAQHLVDAYAIQHATNPDRRSRQSVAAHLMSLCASLEFDMPGMKLRSMIGDWTHRDYPILLPRPDHYPITVRTVTNETEDKRAVIVKEMARSTWSAWLLHHDEVRSLLVNYLA